MLSRVDVNELPTPALVVHASTLGRNLATMARTHPGARLRPHVKAHKCTALAHMQRNFHPGFTCATVRETVGLARVGLGDDLLLANEVVDPARLAELASLTSLGARVTIAVDSTVTIDAAAAAGLRECVIDVNVGMPRCGCALEDAGRLADHARRSGLGVRGVMGYEGHLVLVDDRSLRESAVEGAMRLLLDAHDAVGGELVTAGGTGTSDVNTWATEIQAGSYALMDTKYATLGLPFELALCVVATVVSVSAGGTVASGGWAVSDAGLKSFGMDHGDPAIEDAIVWACSDEHTIFSAHTTRTPRVGDRIRMWPAHIDPTVAYHERMYVVDDTDTVIDEWSVDLRGW
jgi:D-serine deaminase-like pyridoxal phosphate-dependent protein